MMVRGVAIDDNPVCGTTYALQACFVSCCIATCLTRLLRSVRAVFALRRAQAGNRCGTVAVRTAAWHGFGVVLLRYVGAHRYIFASRYRHFALCTYFHRASLLYLCLVRILCGVLPLFVHLFCSAYACICCAAFRNLGRRTVLTFRVFCCCARAASVCMPHQSIHADIYLAGTVDGGWRVIGFGGNLCWLPVAYSSPCAWHLCCIYYLPSCVATCTLPTTFSYVAIFCVLNLLI